MRIHIPFSKRELRALDAYLDRANELIPPGEVDEIIYAVTANVRDYLETLNRMPGGED